MNYEEAMEHGYGGGDPDEGWDPAEVQDAVELECLDAHKDDPCKGPVEYRQALTATGTSFPRCEKHWERRLKEQERIQRTYPPQAPSDFDPGYAGERWEEDY